MAVGILSAVICIGAAGGSIVARAAEEDVVTEEDVVIEEISLDETNFPDENFRNYIKEFDTDENGSFSVSEIEAVRHIYLEGKNIENLDGIKNFSNLKFLDCYYENLQKLDLSGMSSLIIVCCTDNENLTDLNVSGCINLNSLTCDNNNLRRLNIEGCKALCDLECNDNMLQELNVNDCGKLEKLICDHNELSELDVAACRKLSYFDCSYNHLEKLDVSWKGRLEDFYCFSNELQELNVTGCFHLGTFNCNNNHLKKLYLTDCEHLLQLMCDYNELQILDVTDCKNLLTLSCEDNELRELNLTNCVYLESVICDWNHLTELDLTGLGSISVSATGNYINEERDADEYLNVWCMFPMRKYTFAGNFSEATNMIPYTDLGYNLAMRGNPYMGVTGIVSFGCITNGWITDAEGMTYSDEAGAFYIEPFEKEKTVSFTYLGHTVEMRLVNMNFQDVRTKDWFFDPVAYVNGNDLMTGMNETTFAPSDTLARAQFAVILHRMNGKPAMQYTEKFPDVDEKLWYTDAVLWASQAKVVNGYTSNGCFGPADQITREQMAVMMYRYAVFKGYDTSVRKEIDTFADAADVSTYALDAMQWAVGNEIITGKTINGQLVLDPKGYANRAECAAIIMRLMMKYKE